MFSRIKNKLFSARQQSENGEMDPMIEENEEAQSLELRKFSSRSTALLKRIKVATADLHNASDLSRASFQNKIFQYLQELLKAEDGVPALDSVIPDLINAGLLRGGGWEKASRLSPTLVSGSFFATGVYPTLETVSELRVLAIREGRLVDSEMSSSEAEQFLLEVMALNLNFLFGVSAGTEEARGNSGRVSYVQNVFRYLASKIEAAPLFAEVVKELQELILQRPISTRHIEQILISAKCFVEEHTELKNHKSYDDFNKYYGAIYFLSPLGAQAENAQEYRLLLKQCSNEELEAEVNFLHECLVHSGLSCSKSAVLLRHLVKRDPEKLQKALALDESGELNLKKNAEFIHSLIALCIRPSTYYSIYGLSCMLNRQVLNITEVQVGLKRLVDADLSPYTQKQLLKHRMPGDSISANSILIAGLVSVLGQPLGVSQGNNPTCQAARGISLWSQHDPGFLIDAVTSVARYEGLQVEFEGEIIDSKNLALLQQTFDSDDVDAVSSLLSPHLNTIYGEMLARCAGRGEDAHKWANPGLYGRFVQFGFASVLDLTQTVVQEYENFVRRFYSTHHPDYMDDELPVYANPVGIFITNAHADLIGLHAVSIQRIAPCQEGGEMRVYFFNPNREGRQTWGQGIEPSVTGHGEQPGESSLPFDEFVSRLYAFHYNPYEEGDGFGVEKSIVDKVQILAKESWGRAYQWI